MARIPSGVAAHRHRDVRQADAGGFVQRFVHIGHQPRIGSAFLGRETADALRGAGAEVERPQAAETFPVQTLEARQPRELAQHVAAFHERAGGQSRHRGVGRRLPFDPAAQVRQRRPHQRRMVDDVERMPRLLAGEGEDVGGGQNAADVLRASEEIVAFGAVARQVRAAVRRNMDECCVAAPILPRGIGGDHLRHCAGGLRVSIQSIAFPGQGIPRRRAGEGKALAEGCSAGARRLREAMVEVAALAAGNVDVQAVEDAPASRVAVQAEVQQMAQRAAGLRRAESKHLVESALDWALASAQARRGVAQREQSTADHARIARPIRQRVDAPLLEAAVLVDEAPARLERFPAVAADGSAEAPSGAGNLHLHRHVVVAHEQAHLLVVEARWRIGHLAELPEGHESAIAAGLHAAHHLAFNGLAIAERHRRVQAQARRVPLPADARHREATAK